MILTNSKRYFHLSGSNLKFDPINFIELIE